MANEALFQPLTVGALTLSHRVVMAPLTRLRSRQPGTVPQEMNAVYYGQRATKGGLQIAEATDISPTAVGYPGAPGIWTDEQVAGWKLVTDAVHAKGGFIFDQIWHTGRISHSSMQPGGAVPFAPSAIARLATSGPAIAPPTAVLSIRRRLRVIGSPQMRKDAAPPLD